MYNILTLNKIAAIGTNVFGDNYKVASEIDNPTAILVRSAAMHDMELPESVVGVARAGAGVNNIPIDSYSKKGVVVFNTPGANANAVKELVIAAMLLSSRKIVDGINWANGLEKNDDVPKLVEKGKSQFGGCEIAGKRLGIIGLGAIGALVANAALALGMEVIGIDPYISVEGAWRLPNFVKRAASNKEIFETCDYITMHAPLTSETTDTIDMEALSQLKKGVKIINTSRGALVNTEAVLKGIEEGIISCYVTDFPDKDMIGKPGIIAIPHLGASTEESEDNCAVMAASQIKDFIENGNIVNSVNFPNVTMERQTKYRIAVTHKNIPNMLGNISLAVGSLGININDMLNKSKGENGYTLIDIDDAVTQELLDKIAGIDGIFKVRECKA